MAIYKRTIEIEIFQFFIANFLSITVYFSCFNDDKQREKDVRVEDCQKSWKTVKLCSVFIHWDISILLAIFGQLDYDKKCISTLD